MKSFKNNINHVSIFIIFFALLYFFVVYPGTSYIQNWDFYWRPSKHIGYSNIYKSYFFDFFNSFYLYNSEIGYDHSSWYFNQLNPYYALSFILEDNKSYFIQLSNLISYIIALFCLIKISNLLKFNNIQKIFFVLILVTYLYSFAYSQNDPRFNDLMLLWIFLLFFVELNLNKEINYKFYLFFFIYISLVCSYFVIFHAFLIITTYVILFHKFRKTQIHHLFFFFIINLFIWLIVLAPILFGVISNSGKGINLSLIFKSGALIDFLIKYNQVAYIRELRIGSDLFLYIPIGLLLFSIINLSNFRLFKNFLISIVTISFLIHFINQVIAQIYTGNFRFFLNYYHIIIILFIYFNLFNLLKKPENKSYIFILPFCFIIDLWWSKYFRLNKPNLIDFAFICVLYLPFILIFLKKFKNSSIITTLVLIAFFSIKPFYDLKVLKRSESPTKLHSIELYNDFIKCFKTNTPYQAYDRILATGIHKTERNYISIQNMLTERERGTDLNILYVYRESMNKELLNSYKLMLKDYKYFGLRKFPPAFYNKNTNEFRFSDNYFTEIGANIAIVFNDPEKKFTSFKSFEYIVNCKNDLYEADIYTSIIPRGSATLKKNDGNEIKLISKNKNSWDISKLQYENSEFVLRFAKFTNTKILIDNKPVKFSYKDGKFVIPFSKGNEIKILYENFIHKMVFIATLLKYLILIILFLYFLTISFRKLKLSKINI